MKDIARFLMNTQLIAGGYNWVIVPVEQRNNYMAALWNRQAYIPKSKILRN
ncbi:MAG: hypothetical protein LBC40_05425 [Dysgonamonadaceae bacterium]|jgi:hypothetical protein|nr:hypothetical protein [Dysgonamonadaceae bacterium]